MRPETFLDRHRLFTREELVAELPGRAVSTVDAHLARWRRQGRVARVKPGVFVRLDPADSPKGVGADFIALASRMTPDAAVAYHTALETHGLAQSLFERLTFITWTKAKPIVFAGRRFVPVRPRAQLLSARRGEAWIEKVDRAGLEIRVTNLERTIVDVLDRADLAGGLEEVWRSLQAIPAIDPRPLEEYVTLLGSKTLTAKVGFFLEARRDELVVPSALLERLRVRRPSSPVYMDRRVSSRLVSRWGLLVPIELLRAGEGEPE